MNSYLDLIPISAKVHKRQNRMTILCIVISVLLVTAIFSVSDMMIQTQFDRSANKSGTWHIRLDNISSELADKIAAREDVARIGAATIFNFEGDQPYRLNGKRVALYGIDQAYLELNSEGIVEGRFPQSENEIMLSENTASILQISLGDPVTLNTPAGEYRYTVVGLGGVDQNYFANQYFLMDAYLPRAAFAALMAENGIDIRTSYCVQFSGAALAAKAIPELTKQYALPDGTISENKMLMGLSGQSSDASIANVYSMAAVLFVLVLLAGVLMISGSMNSNVAQRTQFFGMMRCIGMSKPQVIRFVRLQVLNWCKTAIPVGVVWGTLISWGICGSLRYGIGGEFALTPVFKLSPIGIAAGILVGVVTALLSAQSPARRAAKVSPIAAVSGNSTNVAARHAVRFGFGSIETSLGIHHAIAGKKNWLLMTASFALSIILVLCFSVLLNFVTCLLPSQAPYQPDILLNGYANAPIISREWIDELRKLSGVRQIWAVSSLMDVPVSSDRVGVDHVILVSYDNDMMAYSESLVVDGSLPENSADSTQVMTIYSRSNPLKVGDTVRVNGIDLTISCAFSQGVFPDYTVVICPQALYDRLVGVQNYFTAGILLDDSADRQTLFKIAALASDDIIISDERENTRQSNATYMASRIVAYGFLAIIALISLFNIINSISMSVSSRTKQYGVMRAIGMDNGQLIRMISAESVTYALSGLITGCGIGLLLSRMLHARLITRYFGIAWHIPYMTLALLTLFVFAAAAFAAYTPAKRVCAMPITATINEL